MTSAEELLAHWVRLDGRGGLTEEQLEHGVVLARALADWMRRGARWAVVPHRLVEWAGAGDELAGWASLPEVMLERCLEHVEAGSAAVRLHHLCLLPEAHSGLHGYQVGDANGYPAEALAAKFAVQMDPVQRIARRAAHAAGMKVGAIASVEVTA